MKYFNFRVKNFSVKADKTKVNFSGVGVGAVGLKEYRFTLDLLNEINSDKIKSVQTGGKIDVFLPKIKNGFWARLVNFNYAII